MILGNYYKNNNEIINQKIYRMIDDLYNAKKFRKEDFKYLLDHVSFENFDYIKEKAFAKRISIYNDLVYIRGLIEISNYCVNDCYYCGIRKSNNNIERYRYDKSIILDIVDMAYHDGYRTFVLQGGVDFYYDDDMLISIISNIKKQYNDCTITLSLGEKSKESYQKLYDAGARRYLLRHESANKKHYALLHPNNMSFDNRIDCLYRLKDIGYQTGAGLMIGSPYQTNDTLVDDLYLLQTLQPEMIGIGPYLKHQDTPFCNQNNGDINHVLLFYALARLICHKALIPSTTATSSLESEGRFKALQAGCNVIMINLSNIENRKNYSLYENKTYLGDESKEYINKIINDIENAGLRVDFSNGNHIDKE